MNLKQINEIRVHAGLPALVSGTKRNNQAANQAKRAQECRDLKAKRNSNKR